MNAKAEVQSSGFDTVKLLLSVLVLIGGVVGFYYFEGHSQLLRVLGLLAVVVVSGFIALQTERGRAVATFLGDSRTEVRKVVWPTRQETVQTTLIVFAMVLVMGIALWLVDMLLMAIVRAVTG